MNTILFVGEHARTYDVQWHSHDYWELVYCTSGAGVFHFQEERSIPYCSGELVAIPPDTLHENTGGEAFANIHLNLENPAFPYKIAFKVQDQDGLLCQAMSMAKNYFATQKNRK